MLFILEETGIYNMNKKAFGKYLLATALFGANGIVAAQISLSSYQIVFLRTVIGSLLMTAIFLISGRRFTFFRKPRNLLLMLISGLTMGGGWLLLYAGYNYLGVGLSSLLYYCGPVIVMALSPVFFREKLTAGKLCCFALVLLGLVLVNGPLELTQGNIRLGVICGLLSAVMYAVMVICNKKMEDVGGMENATMQLVISFLLVGGVFMAKNGLDLTILPGDWPWIILLGAVNTALGCYFYFSAIGDLQVQTVAVCGYAEPLLAVILSVLLLGEKMSLLQWAGALLIIGGAVAAELTGNKNSKKIPGAPSGSAG